MLALDHIAIAAETLAEGTAYVEDTLGVTLGAIGVHDRMGTHNRLLSLGPGVYLEVIAVDPDAPKPAWPRWFDLDRFRGPPRLACWVARTEDMDAALAVAPPGSGTPMALSRGDFSWRIALAEDGRLPFGGAAPVLIKWDCAVHPTERLPDAGCRLVEMTIEHPEATTLLAGPQRLSGIQGVHIVPGAELAMSALIDTPSGRKRLG